MGRLFILFLINRLRRHNVLLRHRSNPLGSLQLAKDGKLALGFLVQAYDLKSTFLVACLFNTVSLNTPTGRDRHGRQYYLKRHHDNKRASRRAFESGLQLSSWAMLRAVGGMQ